MKLITEEVSTVKFVTEGKGASKRMYIEGVFLQGGIKNRNGRMYPVETLAREVNRYNESFVKKGRALGELLLLNKKELILKVEHKFYQHQWVR